MTGLITNILVPVDFSERSTASVEHALAIAKHFEAKVVVLHVVAPPFATYPLPPDGGLYPAAADPSADNLMAHARGQMASLLEKLPAGGSVQELIVPGDPASQIEELVEERQFDLLIMPTHGYGLFRRFVLGSVTAKVLHDVSCSVFTGTHIPEIAFFKPAPYRRIACAIDLRKHNEVVLRWAWRFSRAWEADLNVIHAVPSVEWDATPGNVNEILVRGARESVHKLLDKLNCKAEMDIGSADPSEYVREVVGTRGRCACDWAESSEWTSSRLLKIAAARPVSKPHRS